MGEQQQVHELTLFSGHPGGSDGSLCPSGPIPFPCETHRSGPCQYLALLLLPESALRARPTVVLGGSDVTPALLALPASGALEGLTQYL